MANMKIWISGILTTALLMAMIPGSGNAQSVEQRDYTFTMEITQNATTRTFVIGEFARARHPRPPAEIPVAEKNKGKLTIKIGQTQAVIHSLIEPILFDLASSRLTEQAKEKILLSLPQKVSRSTPLRITGFTCDLGPQAVNDSLALQRATVVAELLRDNGYLVSSVTGKGKKNYISNRPHLRHLNRRVEIKVMDQHSRVLPGENYRSKRGIEKK